MISSVVTSVPMMAVVPTISGLGISRPLAIIMMSVGVRRSITVSVGSVSVGVAVVARLSSGGGLRISLSISGPLAVVVSSVASIASIASIASTVPSISSIPVASIAGLGGNNSEEDDGESNQKFHVVRSSFST